MADEAPIPVLFCGNRRLGGRKSCGGSGSAAVAEALRQAAAAAGVAVSVTESACFGWCNDGPNLRVLGGPVFHGVTLATVETIVDALRRWRDEGNRERDLYQVRMKN